ncbi:type II toxin-antitoxin system prevent-host-death family antitoxin [bacterium]|nr:type II toxin-antitoxin system prevent-host-death family antitoxin [bacterium]
MQTASVREFKIHATKYLGSKEEVVVTRYGKPIAVVTPVEDKSAGSILLELRSVLKDAGVTKKEALKALDNVRREVYGRRSS